MALKVGSVEPKPRPVLTGVWEVMVGVIEGRNKREGGGRGGLETTLQQELRVGLALKAMKGFPKPGYADLHTQSGKPATGDPCQRFFGLSKAWFGLV